MRRDGIIVILLLAALGGLAPPIFHHFFSHHSNADRPPPCCTVVRLAVGSESARFFNDPRVQQVFRANGFDVQVTQFGSLEMCGANFDNYDAAVVSSTNVAQQLESCVLKLKGQTEITLFRTPLAIATHSPIARCMQQLGIAQFSNGFWRFYVNKYINAVLNGASWSQCGSLVSPLTGSMYLHTTNPRCSNSGELFLGDASYAYNKSPVLDPKSAQHVGSTIAPIIGDQGGAMEVTTDVLFQDYLGNGQSYTPMALIYEAEFIGEEIDQPQHITPDMLLMYPTPDVFAQRVLIPVPGPKDRSVEAIGELLGEQPLMQYAQELFGFRYNDTREFLATIGKHAIFGKQITAPADLQEGTVPPADILKDLVNVAEPTYPDITSSASPNSAPAC